MPYGRQVIRCNSCSVGVGDAEVIRDREHEIKAVPLNDPQLDSWLLQTAVESRRDTLERVRRLLDLQDSVDLLVGKGQFVPQVKSKLSLVLISARNKGVP